MYDLEWVHLVGLWAEQVNNDNKKNTHTRKNRIPDAFEVAFEEPKVWNEMSFQTKYKAYRSIGMSG